MSVKRKKKKVYLNVVFTLVLTYLIIKLIDNYQYFFGMLDFLIGLLMPFVIAFVLAYIFNPIIKFFENKFKAKRGASLFIAYGGLIAVLLAILVMTLPVIIESIIDIVNHAPTYFAETEKFLINFSRHLENIDAATMQEIWDKISNMLPNLSSLFVGSIGEIFKKTFSFGKFIFNLVLAFIICFYILLEKEKIFDFLKKVVYVALGDKKASFTFSFGKFIFNLVLAFIICFYILLEKEKIFDFLKKVVYVALGDKKASFVLTVSRDLNENVGKYFTGKIFDSIIVGVLSGIGLFVLKSKYALLFGTLMGLMNMIPYFGPAIGMAPVVLINLFSDPKIALFSLIYLLVVQQVEVAFIEPKIVGGQLGLSPFLTILAVTVGGGFFGIPGMILSTPIMGVLKVYITEYVETKSQEIHMSNFDNPKDQNNNQE